MKDYIINALEKEGYIGRFVGLGCLDAIKNEYNALLNSGAVFNGLKESYLSRFEFAIPPEFPEAVSVLTVAVPSPQYIIKFEYKGNVIKAPVPPTYTHYYTMHTKVMELLTGIAEGARFVKTKIPEKFLASKSGMFFYGRNNIGYVPGLGSFFQLVSFYTNIPVGSEPFNPTIMLERCRNCYACVNSCPVDAIAKDRFLIRAEKCLTFINENPGEISEKIKPASHNSLIGCMICQKICPENKKAKMNIAEGAVFNGKETEILLSARSENELPEEVRKKLDSLELVGIQYGYNEFKRNLKLLFNNSLPAV